MKEVIAIDGYAATGKSTQAKNIAKHLNFIHIDTATYGAEFSYMEQVIEERNFYDLNSSSATNELILPTTIRK